MDYTILSAASPEPMCLHQTASTVLPLSIESGGT